jgi:DNA-binding IclR family transcriptional regulator
MLWSATHWSVAAPVRGVDGPVIAALGMSASVASADEETMRERFAQMLVRAAARISERLGADFSPGIARSDVPAGARR